MSQANIGELKNNLSKFFSFIQRGEVVQICKRNKPIALLMPDGSLKSKNRTKLGCGMGTVQVKADLTEPMIPMEV